MSEANATRPRPPAVAGQLNSDVERRVFGRVQRIISMAAIGRYVERNITAIGLNR